MKRLVEIRSYKLLPGTAAQFHAVASERAVPMVRGYGMDVIAFGPSPHEPDTYYLVRAFNDLAHRAAQQDEFYGSQAWLEGPREPLVGLIDSYLDTVLWLSPASIEDLRVSHSA